MAATSLAMKLFSKLQMKYMIKTTVNDELLYWLVLNRCPKIGLKRLKDLIRQGRSLKSWFNGRQPTQDFVRWYQIQAKEPLILDWAGAEKDLSWAGSPDCHILTLSPLSQQKYPAWLKQIASPPPVLFVRGNVSLLHEPQIAMVGSRKTSSQGQQNAYAFAKQLSSWGMVVTSGLALGVDGACHQGALEQDQHTIAVMGRGLDQIYPRAHIKLAERILERGAWVSEIPIGIGPRREHFPRRNRIISGLSLGVIVVEAAKKSGSLITANYALDQGREIFALPGSINNPMAMGCHQLIRQGAMCVDNPAQIMEALRPQLTGTGWDASIVDERQESHKPNISMTKKEEIHSQLDPAEAEVLAFVTDNCTPLDGIVDQSGLTSQQVSTMLLNLELQGCIKTVPGGVIRI
tara:strand:+ start:29105 stop:30319 length:1215 start_codon:yes stop_codon:yes gene_type:complete